jgi:hypothetical protein
MGSLKMGITESRISELEKHYPQLFNAREKIDLKKV